MNIDESILEAALVKWGVDAQVKMFREECLEAALAVGKYTERDSSEQRFENLIDETADVIIMATQMKLIPGWEKMLQERIDYKVARLKKRIEKKQF